LAEQLADRHQSQSGDRKITVTFPADFPVMMVDEIRIRQVISNLIMNSIKYAPSGDIAIHGQVTPEQVIISVTDEGPGINASDEPHIFDRFYRSPEAVRRTKGAGLGLFLAKAIVEAHGGQIWVETQRKQGARISFSLPRG
jgi:signal transduction histidine kinase